MWAQKMISTPIPLIPSKPVIFPKLRGGQRRIGKINGHVGLPWSDVCHSPVNPMDSSEGPRSFTCSERDGDCSFGVHTMPEPHGPQPPDRPSQSPEILGRQLVKVGYMGRGRRGRQRRHRHAIEYGRGGRHPRNGLRSSCSRAEGLVHFDMTDGTGDVLDSTGSPIADELDPEEPGFVAFWRFIRLTTKALSRPTAAQPANTSPAVKVAGQ